MRDARRWMLVGVMLLLGREALAQQRPARPARATRVARAAPTPAPRVLPLAVPFTVEFRPRTYAESLPALHSYSVVSVGGKWLVIGGRFRQGLHMFKGAPASNFPRDSSNDALRVIDPVQGQVWSTPLSGIGGDLGAMLGSTNTEAWYDRANDRAYVVGGYGWNAQKTNMLTFPYLLIFRAGDVMQAVTGGASGDSVAKLFTMVKHDSLAVTGGTLSQVNDIFYLVFGQLFNGQYRAFGANDTTSGRAELPFVQQYTNEVRRFLVSRSAPYRVTLLDPLTSGDTSQPFHRRDGNFVDDIDPASGTPRIGAFGGVFRPGIIGAYTTPVYVDGTGARLDRTVSQRFNQYECPVIVLYDSVTKTTFRTFFGGIGNTYRTQTTAQHDTFNLVTAQGRNDGFPFIADISVLSQTAAGKTTEVVLLQPTPDTLLVGASALFVPSDSLYGSALYANGAVNLRALAPGTPVRIGWIYGGIQADNPLPAIPNAGTHGSGKVFEVWLTPGKGMPALPASVGIPARKGEAIAESRRKP